MTTLTLWTTPDPRTPATDPARALCDAIRDPAEWAAHQLACKPCGEPRWTEGDRT